MGINEINRNDKEIDKAANLNPSNSQLQVEKLYNEDLFERFKVTFLPNTIEENRELTSILVYPFPNKIKKDQHDVTKDTRYPVYKESVYEKLGPFVEAGGGENERRFYVAKAGDKGYGVFADEFIQKGDIIGVYTGVLTVESKEIEYDYDYEWSYYSRPIVNGKELIIGLDGKNKGNMLRFLNDGDVVNCENITVAWNNRWHAVVIAMSDIQVGDELQLSYGSGFWEDREGSFVA
jgi:hypothetical protein